MNQLLNESRFSAHIGQQGNIPRKVKINGIVGDTISHIIVIPTSFVFTYIVYRMYII